VKAVLKEFKDFIAERNVVEIAVGAAICGEGSFTEIGIDIGDARISIGLVIDALISFVAVAFFLFLVVKAYNNFKRSDPAAGPSDNQLLTEIRDELRAGRQSR
jgi:large conductance mechanosensitive channel